jgi:hypothetical protein
MKTGFSLAGLAVAAALLAMPVSAEAHGYKHHRHVDKWHVFCPLYWFDHHRAHHVKKKVVKKRAGKRVKRARRVKS